MKGHDDTATARLFWELAATLILEDHRVAEGTIMGGRCLRVGQEFLALVDYKGSGLVVKLTAERVGELIAEGIGRPFAPAGRVFKEWVSLPTPDRARWASALREGVTLAASGDGKPPKKVAPKKKATTKAPRKATRKATGTATTSGR